jgi:hypothetical protein
MLLWRSIAREICRVRVSKVQGAHGSQGLRLSRREEARSSTEKAVRPQGPSVHRPLVIAGGESVLGTKISQFLGQGHNAEGTK